MVLPVTSPLQPLVIELESAAKSAKTQAQLANTALTQGNVSTDWIFGLIDRVAIFISVLDRVAAISGIDAFAIANIPGYTGILTTDITTTRSAAASCISWVTTNFPRDPNTGFILAYVLNADGSRTPRQFTTVQTAGLQTALQNLVNTIG